MKVRPGMHLEGIPDGEAGTIATMQRMRDLAIQGSEHPIVKATAQRILSQHGKLGASALARLACLFDWVRDSITYTRDGKLEKLSAPERTLETQREDCDGKATLLASLALSVGVPVRMAFRAISIDPAAARRFVHVYLVARPAAGNSAWIGFDCTYKGTPAGWQYPGRVASLEVSL